MRVGLLGGSFFPAHAGHLYISEEAIKKLSLKEVWWLVTPGNPLKPSSYRDNYHERFNSAEEISAPNKKIKVSDIEKKTGSIYTVDTIKRLKKLYPDHQFYWIMGADNLENFHKWKNWREIPTLVRIVVFDRPEHTYKAVFSRAAMLLKGKISFYFSKRYEVSSSKLRKITKNQ